MRDINGIYTQGFNKRHRKVGHLFQGRYTAHLVDKDAYLMELSRYVVLNPVRASMVSWPRQYVWSSYRATTGQVTAPPWLDVDHNSMRYKALIEGNNFLMPGKAGRVGFFATLSIEARRGEDVVEELRLAGIRRISEFGLVSKNNWIMCSCCFIKEVWQHPGEFNDESDGGATFFRMGLWETLSAAFFRAFAICFKRQFIIL